VLTVSTHGSTPVRYAVHYVDIAVLVMFCSRPVGQCVYFHIGYSFHTASVRE